MDNGNPFVVKRKRNLLADSWVVGRESFNSDEREEQGNRAPHVSSLLINDQNDLSEPLLSPQEPQESILNQVDQPNAVPSRNINLILAFTLFAFAGRSLWSQSVLSTLVYLLQNDNPEAVGFITGVMGMTQLIAAFPTGVLADRHRRDSMLKISSFVGFVAVAVTLVSVWKESYIWLTVALAVWGTFWGIASTSLSALFADSIREGDRSFYFTKRSIILKLGNCTGPFVALILFAALGDHWTIRDCSIVMGVGQIVCLPAMFLLCCLNDDDAIIQNEQSQEVEGSTDEMEYSIPESTILERETRENSFSKYCCCCIPEHRFIPVLIATADVLSGLGSGLSIRYFPIFFFEHVKLSPIIVQILYIISPIGQAVLMHGGQVVVSRNVGRCKTSVALKWTGIACMLLMIGAYTFHFPTWVVCFFYLLRTSFMNATSALTKSLLMDAVPKHERAKWSALESVNMFSWSGSAAIGELLVGYKGIIFNFLVTGSVQFLGTVPLVLLFSRDGREGGAKPALAESDLQVERQTQETKK
jgi:MFS family permease